MDVSRGPILLRGRTGDPVLDREKAREALALDGVPFASREEGLHYEVIAGEGLLAEDVLGHSPFSFCITGTHGSV